MSRQEKTQTDKKKPVHLLSNTCLIRTATAQRINTRNNYEGYKIRPSSENEIWIILASLIKTGDILFFNPHKLSASKCHDLQSYRLCINYLFNNSISHTIEKQNIGTYIKSRRQHHRHFLHHYILLNVYCRCAIVNFSLIQSCDKCERKAPVDASTSLGFSIS